MKSTVMTWTFVLLLGFVTLGIVGCGGSSDSGNAANDPNGDSTGQDTSIDEPNDPTPPPPPPPPAPAGTQTDNTSGEDEPPSPPPGAVVATPGVTGKGQDYGPGPVSTPVATYFNVRERIVFEVKVAPAMKMFQATNGRFPKSQAEFDKQILGQNMITLPKLPPGKTYFYDAKKAATMRNYDPKDPPILVIDEE